MAQLWAIALVLSGAILGSFTMLFFKFASENISFDILKIIKNKYLYLAVFYTLIATALFIPALRGGELSVLYPLISTSYVWVSLLSIIFLKEKMGFLKGLGVLTIILGVIFLSLGS